MFLADRNILADQAFNDFSAFPEDALARIRPDEIRKQGRVPTNGSIFFTIFQTFMSGRDKDGNPAPYWPASTNLIASIRFKEPFLRFFIFYQQVNKKNVPLSTPAQIKVRLTAGHGVFPKPWFDQLMGDAQYLACLIQMDHWMREYRVIIA